MFKSPRHHDVLKVLRALDADLLTSNGFLFGGGTRIVLELAEFRESLDVDFLCSDASGYGELRWRARSHGYASLLTSNRPFEVSFPREMRIDQYGIRFPASVGENLIKVELIREGGIDLGSGVRPDWSPVDCLSIDDCYAVKLLANSDRWADRQVLARDLIDIAALRRHFGPIPEESWAKATAAYKSAPREDLGKAVSYFLADTRFQARCFEGLKVAEPEVILDGVAVLADDLGQ